VNIAKQKNFRTASIFNEKTPAADPEPAPKNGGGKMSCFHLFASPGRDERGVWRRAGWGWTRLIALK
jgi:hypothetical protein